jgi:putative ABC transport system permease protein
VGILTAIDGLKASIDTSFSSLGANTFDIRRVRPERGTKEGKEEKQYPMLQKDEVFAFQEMFESAKSTVHLFVSNGVEVKYLSQKTNPNITLRGVDDNYMLIRNYNIASGRNFTGVEVRNGSNVVIVGHQVIQELFRENVDPINKAISFYGNKYRIIGVLEEKGGFGGSTYADRTLFIPIKNAIRVSNRGYLEYRVTVSVRDPLHLEHTMGEATGLMRRIRQDPVGSEPSFELERNKTLEEELGEITTTLRIGGFSIGIITLLGASIGLMNIMLVSVTERTREIGVRKAIGANPRKIRQQFLIEAIVICMFGGIAGVVFGIGMGNVISMIFDSNTFVAPWEWVILGFAVCLIVGLISGFYPAYKASKLNPIMALHYE